MAEERGYGLLVINHLKKGVFSKNALIKSYGITYILRQCQQPVRPYCVFTSTVTSPYAKEANKMLSSTRRST